MRTVGQLNCHNAFQTRQADLQNMHGLDRTLESSFVSFEAWNTFVFHKEHLLCHIYFLPSTIYVSNNENIGSGSDKVAQ